MRGDYANEKTPEVRVSDISFIFLLSPILRSHFEWKDATGMDGDKRGRGNCLQITSA